MEQQIKNSNGSKEGIVSFSKIQKNKFKIR
jgi:hypothetical protein